MTKIKLNYLYSGDYTKEFGGSEKIHRIWKRYHVLVDNEIRGELYVEPRDCENRYRYRYGEEFLVASNLTQLKNVIRKTLVSR